MSAPKVVKATSITFTTLQIRDLVRYVAIAEGHLRAHGNDQRADRASDLLDYIIGEGARE